MLFYDNFTIALCYSVKLPFSQFARVYLVCSRVLKIRILGSYPALLDLYPVFVPGLYPKIIGFFGFSPVCIRLLNNLQVDNCLIETR